MSLELYLPVLLLLALILAGVPVSFSMLISGAIGMTLALGYTSAAALIPGVMYDNVADYILTTVPMFILMGEFLRVSGITEDIFHALDVWTASFRGGLAIATTGANGLMAALTGSSTASVATLSSIAVPEMRRYGYDDRLSLGTVAAAGTFAIMIPPSLGLIFVGILTDTNIGDLFIAGIIPGALTLVGYIFVIRIWIYRNDDVARENTRTYTWKDRLDTLRPLWPAIILIAVVLGGIYGGIVTPTEAGALGASGAFLTAVLFKGSGLKDVYSACLRTVELTTMVFFILIGAYVFSTYFAVTGATQALLNATVGLPFQSGVILAMILLLYVVAGMFMNQLAILILTIPITFPLIVGEFGYSPIWFGIVVVKTIEIGLVTPPLGLNCYVASSPIDVDVSTTFQGAIRFLIADIAVLVILFLWPSLTTVLL